MVCNRKKWYEWAAFTAIKTVPINESGMSFMLVQLNFGFTRRLIYITWRAFIPGIVLNGIDPQIPDCADDSCTQTYNNQTARTTHSLLVTYVTFYLSGLGLSKITGSGLLPYRNYATEATEKVCLCPSGWFGPPDLVLAVRGKKWGRGEGKGEEETLPPLPSHVSLSPPPPPPPPRLPCFCPRTAKTRSGDEITVWPKRTGSDRELKWKGPRRERTFFSPQLSKFPHFDRPEREN